MTRLVEVAPELARIRDAPESDSLARYSAEEVHRETAWVAMRDGTHLATDLYLPPVQPGPVVSVRTPYGRAVERLHDPLMALARMGYACVSQDCRGTGESEPDHWDYYV